MNTELNPAVSNHEPNNNQIQSTEQIKVSDKENTMNEFNVQNNGMTIETINLDRLVTPVYHPRTTKTETETLAKSIATEGLHIPLTVMKSGDGTTYMVLDGTRRLEALREMGEESAPCVIKSEVDDVDAAHTAYVINMERKTLTPVEQALHLKMMQDDYGFTLRDLEVKGYGSTGSISQKLKVLDLPEEIQQKIVEGKLTEAHGRQLLKLPSEGEQERMAKRVMDEDLSANKLSGQVDRYLRKKSKEKRKPMPNAPDADIPNVYFKDSSNMSEMAKKSVHLIVTSPPYGIGKEYDKDYTPDEAFEDNKLVLDECARVLVPGGIMALNIMDIQNYSRGKGDTKREEWLFVGVKYQQYLRGHKLYLTDVIQWEKPVYWQGKARLTMKDNTPHTAYRIACQVEQILIFRKEGEREIPSAEIELKSRLSYEQRNEWTKGVWDISHQAERKEVDHPCPYPEELCDRLIKMFSFEGDTVLDPWLGSGTTVKVSQDLNRHGVGYERDLKYKASIMKRLGLLEQGEGKQTSMTEFMKLGQESIKEKPVFTEAQHGVGPKPEVTTIPGIDQAMLAQAFAREEVAA